MKFRVDVPADFDFLECINAHGWRQLSPFTWDAEIGVLHRIEEFDPGRPVALSIRSEPDELLIDVTGHAPRVEVERRLRRMLQLDLPMTGFHAYCAGHAKLAHVPLRRQGRLLRSPTLFEDVVKVIATTNTTWAQTKAMVARVVDGFGTASEAHPTRKSFPQPGQIAATTAGEFAAAARMGYRSGAVHQIACDIAGGSLDLESWQDRAIPAADLMKRLLSLPGVGPYAASCLMIYLGRYERVNVDSWARMLVGKELGRLVTDKEVHSFFEEYGEWKALAYHFYAWNSDEPEY